MLSGKTTELLTVAGISLSQLEGTMGLTQEWECVFRTKGGESSDG